MSQKKILIRLNKGDKFQLIVVLVSLLVLALILVPGIYGSGLSYLKNILPGLIFVIAVVVLVFVLHGSIRKSSE